MPSHIELVEGLGPCWEGRGPAGQVGNATGPAFAYLPGGPERGSWSG